MPKKAKREDGRYQIVVELGRDKYTQECPPRREDTGY